MSMPILSALLCLALTTAPGLPGPQAGTAETTVVRAGVVHVGNRLAARDEAIEHIARHHEAEKPERDHAMVLQYRPDHHGCEDNPREADDVRQRHQGRGFAFHICHDA